MLGMELHNDNNKQKEEQDLMKVDNQMLPIKSNLFLPVCRCLFIFEYILYVKPK